MSEQSGRATMDRPVSDLTGLLVQWPFETGPETTAGSVMAPSKRDGRDQAVWALRITARDRFSDRCRGWGEPLDIAMECTADRPERRWSGVMKPDVVREGPNYKPV